MKIEDKLSPVQPEIGRVNTRLVLSLLGVFTLVFSVIVPGYMALRYGNFWYPLDFYRMPIRGGDYIATYEAAKHWLSNLPVYTTPDSMGRLYSYPIAHVLLFIPLALMPFELSYRVWCGLTIAMVVLSVWLASRLFRNPWAAFILGIAVMAQSTFILFQLERGQTDVIVLLLITAFLYLYLRGYSKPIVAAVFVIASVIKVFPGLWALFFLLRREFKLLMYALVFSVLVVVCTNPIVWWKYLRETVPAYSDYFLGYSVDHSLFYLVDWLVPIHTDARWYTRIASLAFLGLYIANVSFNRHRDKYVLVEIALLTIIMEVSTPWAANYKLVLLLFVFLSPLSIQELPFVQRRPLFFTLPIFACFALIVPLFGEYVMRIPYTLLTHISPSLMIPTNPINPLIAERKVALGVVLLLVYLMALYTASTVLGFMPREQQSAAASWFDRATSVRRLVIFGTLCVIVLFGVGVSYIVRQDEFIKTIVNETKSEQPMGPAITGIGYRVTERGSGYHTLDLVFRVHGPLPRNYQVYAHAYSPNPTGGMSVTSGKNFFPDTITSNWPSGKVLHTQTTLPMPSDYTELHVGFFSLEDGARYGPEAIFSRR